jgi:hypothetical protein
MTPDTDPKARLAAIDAELETLGKLVARKKLLLSAVDALEESERVYMPLWLYTNIREDQLRATAARYTVFEPVVAVLVLTGKLQPRTAPPITFGEVMDVLGLTADETVEILRPPLRGLGFPSALAAARLREIAMRLR